MDSHAVEGSEGTIEEPRDLDPVSCSEICKL